MVSMIIYRSVSRDVRLLVLCFSVCLNVNAAPLQISRYNAIDLSVCTFPPLYGLVLMLPCRRTSRRIGAGSLSTAKYSGLQIIPCTLRSGGERGLALRHGGSHSRCVNLASPHMTLTLSWDDLVFALLGFLSPSNRGSLATVLMICWTIFGRFVCRLGCIGSLCSWRHIVSVVMFRAGYTHRLGVPSAGRMPS